MTSAARRVGIVLAAVMLLSAASGSRAAEREFQLKGSGVGQFTADGSGFTFTAAGEATQLGRWTNAGAVTVVGPDPDVPGNLAVAGWAKFTAANGDELYAQVTGSLDPATGAGLGVFSWDGGTGRFAGATGTAVFPVQDGPPDTTGRFEFEFTADGLIDF